MSYFCPSLIAPNNGNGHPGAMPFIHDILDITVQVIALQQIVSVYVVEAVCEGLLRTISRPRRGGAGHDRSDK